MQDEGYSGSSRGRKRKHSSVEVEVNKIRDDPDEKIDFVTIKETQDEEETRRFELRRFATEEKTQKVPLAVGDCRTLLAVLLDQCIDLKALNVRIQVAKEKEEEGGSAEQKTAS